MRAPELWALRVGCCGSMRVLSAYAQIGACMLRLTRGHTYGRCVPQLAHATMPCVAPLACLLQALWLQAPVQSLQGDAVHVRPQRYVADAADSPAAAAAAALEAHFDGDGAGAAPSLAALKLNSQLKKRVFLGPGEAAARKRARPEQ